MSSIAPQITEFQAAITRTDVHFMSGGEMCHAWYYRPVGVALGQRRPVVVMAHGLGGVKQACLAAFAERFSAEGYACLVFDYRFFGESGGEPRELLDIRCQLEDWRAAVGFARTLSDVNPEQVIVWGTSFGGGHAIVTAADDARIVAAIAQCPFTDGLASVLAIPMMTNLKIAALALQDRAAKLLGLAPVRVPAAGPQGVVALMTAEDAIQGFYKLFEASGLQEMRIHVPARIGLQIPLHRPGLRAKDVKCPILFSVCNQDTVAPAKATLRHAARAPKGEVVRYDTGHFEIYLGDWFERNVTDQIAFLKKMCRYKTTKGVIRYG